MHIATRRGGDGRWRIIVIKIMERISHSARLYIVQNICNDFKWKMISFLVFRYGGIQSSYDEATWWEWGGVRGSSDKVQALLNFSSSFHLPPLLFDISIWKYAKFKYLLLLVPRATREKQKKMRKICSIYHDLNRSRSALTPTQTLLASIQSHFILL